MHALDLNLLIALDALLDEGSVVGAAQRLHLSPPAMSRTLARIRDALGDPILVRAGRNLVPTPRALQMRDRVRALLAEARALFDDADTVALENIERTFTIRASDGIAGALAAGLLARVRSRAPGINLRFAAEGDEDVAALREGRIDLDIGVLGDSGPEIKLQGLFRDRFVGVVRLGHALSRGRVTAKRFAGAQHISVSRRGRARGPIDAALASQGLSRNVALVVPSFYTALMIAADSDLVAAVPARLALQARALLPVKSFELPITLDDVLVTQAWHPRFDNDAGHRWLRECVRAVCGHENSAPDSPI